MAHAYTPAAIRRSIECGVRTIEHGNLIDAPTARAMAAAGAYAVPTLITYEMLAKHGAEYGLPAESLAKLGAVRNAGLDSLAILKEAGVKMGYGSDLLGALHDHQSGEFRLRAQVLTPHEVIISATAIGAEIIGMEGRLGMVAPGAIADLLVVNGDPLADLGVLDHQGRHIDAIMKAGAFAKNRLG
jgi:imidazolonepropionase-like amidohydrolase